MYNYRFSQLFLKFLPFSLGVILSGFILVNRQLLLPLYGDSFLVEVFFISSVFVGISLGLFLSSFLSRWVNKPYFPEIILLLLILLIETLYSINRRFFISGFSGNYIDVVSKICFMIFTPLMFISSFLIPVFITRLCETSMNPGKVTGVFFSILFLGALCMTELYIFLLADWGVNTNIHILAIFIMIVYLFLILSNKTQQTLWLVPLIGIIYLLVILSEPALIGERKKNLSFKYRSTGFTGQTDIVLQDEVGRKALLFNSVSQTVLHQPSGKSFYSYVPRIVFYSSFKPRGSKVLILGIKGGILANEFSQMGYEVDVCDEEKEYFEIADSNFNMLSNIKKHIVPYRQFINQSQSTYDCIVMDILKGENQLDAIYTIETMYKLRAIMKKDALLFIHYESCLIGSGNKIVKSILKTMEVSGYNCKLINTSPLYQKTSDLLIVGTVDKINLSEKEFQTNAYLSSYNFPIKDKMFIEDVSWKDSEVLYDDLPHLYLDNGQAVREKREVAKQYLYYLFIQGEDLVK